jgi:hypothetical protein
MGNAHINTDADNNRTYSSPKRNPIYLNFASLYMTFSIRADAKKVTVAYHDHHNTRIKEMFNGQQNQKDKKIRMTTEEWKSFSKEYEDCDAEVAPTAKLIKHRILPFAVYGLCGKLNALSQDEIEDLFEVLHKMTWKQRYYAYIQWWTKILNYLSMRKAFPELPALKLPELKYQVDGIDRYAFRINTQMKKILLTMKSTRVREFTNENLEEYTECGIVATPDMLVGDLIQDTQ